MNYNYTYVKLFQIACQHTIYPAHSEDLVDELSSTVFTSSLWTLNSTDFKTPLRSPFGTPVLGVVTTLTNPPELAPLGTISKSSWSGIITRERSWRLYCPAVACMEGPLVLSKECPLKKRTRTAGALATRNPTVSSTVPQRMMGETCCDWTRDITIRIIEAIIAKPPAAKRRYSVSFLRMLMRSCPRLQIGIARTDC